MSEKKILRALKGEVQPVPPVWMMRQAGRYLPEYRATRAEAGDFLSLCYNSDLAAEVTLQPIRRYGFDAAILFADILLLPQALGPKLWFETGEGPRMETTTTPEQVAALRPDEAIHDTLAPVYQTLRILKRELPAETTLIGFAGAPWTVATYMIAGRGKEEQAGAHRLKAEDRVTFQALIDRLTGATIEYLSAQVEAGAEVIKLFDSWAGSLKGQDFQDFAVKPATKIITALLGSHPCAGVSRRGSQQNVAHQDAIGVVQALTIRRVIVLNGIRVRCRRLDLTFQQLTHQRLIGRLAVLGFRLDLQANAFESHQFADDQRLRCLPASLMRRLRTMHLHFACNLRLADRVPCNMKKYRRWRRYGGAQSSGMTMARKVMIGTVRCRLHRSLRKRAFIHHDRNGAMRLAIVHAQFLL